MPDARTPGGGADAQGTDRFPLRWPTSASRRRFGLPDFWYESQPVHCPRCRRQIGECANRNASATWHCTKCGVGGVGPLTDRATKRPAAIIAPNIIVDRAAPQTEVLCRGCRRSLGEYDSGTTAGIWACTVCELEEVRPWPPDALAPWSRVTSVYARLARRPRGSQGKPR